MNKIYLGERVRREGKFFKGPQFIHLNWTRETMCGGSPYQPRARGADTEGLHPVQDLLRLYSEVVLGNREKTNKQESKRIKKCITFDINAIQVKNKSSWTSQTTG